MASVIQTWVNEISMMQQSVLLTAIRGPDGSPKYGPVKLLLRWFRRCVLLSAMDGRVLDNPYVTNGGSFTGPSLGESQCYEDEWEGGMDAVLSDYLRSLDAIPHHFQMHLMHAIEILGYKHPDECIRKWWNSVYIRLVNDMHLFPESEAQMDGRLGDSREGWLARADAATVA